MCDTRRHFSRDNKKTRTLPPKTNKQATYLSRQGRVANGHTTKASNIWVHPSEKTNKTNYVIPGETGEDVTTIPIYSIFFYPPAPSSTKMQSRATPQ